MTNRLKLGQAVCVKWLDSGLSGLGRPGQGSNKLVFNNTYGKVSDLRFEVRLHRLLCQAKTRGSKTCLCGVVELTMCSSDDPEANERAELGVIWVPSIVDVKVLR